VVTVRDAAPASSPGCHANAGAGSFDREAGHTPTLEVADGTDHMPADHSLSSRPKDARWLGSRARRAMNRSVETPIAATRYPQRSRCPKRRPADFQRRSMTGSSAASHWQKDACFPVLSY
jgi:hypothetical protein